MSRPGPLAALLLGLLLAACLGRVPATTYYRLLEPECRPGPGYPYSVALMRLRASPVYQQTALLYRPSAYEIASYPYSRWEAMPADMLTERLYGFLEGCRLFRHVTLRGLSAEPDLVLEGRLVRFEEVDSPEGAFAALGVEFELVRLEGGKIVWQAQLASRTPMEERTPRELARAMSLSLAAVFAELHQRLGPALEGLEGRPGAAGPPPAPRQAS